MIKEAVKQNRGLMLKFLISFIVTCLLGVILGVTASALSDGA